MHPLEIFSPNTWICLLTVECFFGLAGEIQLGISQFIFLLGSLLLLFSAQIIVQTNVTEHSPCFLFVRVCTCAHVSKDRCMDAEARGQAWMLFLRCRSPFSEIESLIGLDLTKQARLHSQKTQDLPDSTFPSLRLQTCTALPGFFCMGSGDHMHSNSAASPDPALYLPSSFFLSHVDV